MRNVLIYPAQIEKHPINDNLEVVTIPTIHRQAVVRKGFIKSGQLVAYIPEHAVVPDWLLTRLLGINEIMCHHDNTIYLNTVDGVVTTGCVYPTIPKTQYLIIVDEDDSISHHKVEEGDDVTSILNITQSTK